MTGNTDLMLATRGVRLWPSEALIRFASKRLRAGQHALELGCGAGGNLAVLAMMGLDVVGMDRDPAMLTLARENLSRFGLRDGARLMHASLPDLGWRGPFDAILDVQCVQHVVDEAARRATLANIAAALRPGGWFFSMHLSAGTRAETYARKFPTVGPVVLSAYDGIVTHIERDGLRCQSIEEVERVYDDGDRVAHYVIEAQKGKSA
jgi:cyclopropane fatty-acyl-phospholipid synthase-like methyltransferase